MATIPRVITYEEWLSMPPVQDGTDEVVKGEYRFMPPTRYPHAVVVQAIISALIPQVDQKRVTILGSNFGLVISREPLTCRSPDLALFWKDSERTLDGLWVSPPDLVVEILSPSENRARKESKLEDYASLGVPEAWLVSPEAETVEIRQLQEGKLTRTSVLLEGDLRPSRFPGVVIPISSIWPAAR